MASTVWQSALPRVTRKLIGVFLIGFGAAWASPTWALELIMIEQEKCPYCKRFNAEIIPDYATSPAGQRAPLRRVDLHDPWPADLDGVTPDQLTPTFILVDNGAEIGRLRGYPGKEEFWSLLEKLLSHHDNR